MYLENLKLDIVPKYLSIGESKFYKYLIVYALNKLVLISKNNYKGSSPEIDLLDYYDKFLVLYRREGEDLYLQIAKTCRKAAHKIYRVLLKHKLTERNGKFLNLV